MIKEVMIWFEDETYQIFDTLDDFYNFISNNKNHKPILRVAVELYSNNKYLGEVEYSYKEFLENYG